MKKYLVKGINDDVTTCDICGKKGLKKVVWLSELDADGNDNCNVFAAGVNCAAKLLGFRGSRDTKTHKIERAYIDAAKQRISKKILEIFVHECFLPSTDGIYIPLYLAGEYKAGRISAREAKRLRNFTFPILGFMDGEATAERCRKFEEYI